MYQKPDFLTDYEFDVLKFTYEGNSIKKTAKILNKSEGSIRKTKVIVRKKIESELQKIADALRLDTNLRIIPKGMGLLIGYDWVHDTYVYLILTGGKITAWYEHECSAKCKPECQTVLDQIKVERGIDLNAEQESLPLLEQFRLVISRIKGEMNE
ncbi:MAG: hypothetical protein ACFFD4_21075 [Candidatus Odinarchaeota archaeon]